MFTHFKSQNIFIFGTFSAARRFTRSVLYFFEASSTISRFELHAHQEAVEITEHVKRANVDVIKDLTDHCAKRMFVIVR